MSQLGTLEAGSRHDLHVGLSPDAPDESQVLDQREGAFGYVHSYETASRYDGPGLRVVLFVSGCLLRCSYCHNPDTWHLKDGTYVAAQQVIDRLGGFASALRALDVVAEIAGRLYRRVQAELLGSGQYLLGEGELHHRFAAGNGQPAASATTTCRASTSCCSTSKARTRTPIAR